MDYMLTVFLATEGVPSAEIKEVMLEPAEYESALVGGAVDALVAFGPHTLTLPAKLGPDRAVVFYSDVYVEMSMLIGRREIVTGKKEAMTRLVRAIVRAQDFAEANAEEGIAIVAARLSPLVTETSVRQLWGTFRPVAKLDNVLLTLLVQEGHWLRESGRFSTPPPDFANAIVPDYLRSVRPSAVTVLSPPPFR
jgi:NitT/TauT family transport system substrate-binding protein